MEWNPWSNPCPYGKSYLMEDGDCYRCPAYQECVIAVEIRDRNNEDRDCWDGDDNNDDNDDDYCVDY